VKVGETTPVGEAPAAGAARAVVMPADVDLVVPGAPSVTTDGVVPGAPSVTTDGVVPGAPSVMTDGVVPGAPSVTTDAPGDPRALVGRPARAAGTTVATEAALLVAVPSAKASAADPVSHPRARVAPSPGSRTGSPARSSTARCTTSCEP